VAGKFYILGIVAGVILISIGTISIFVSQDEYVFIRGMMVIITGMIVLAMGIRFKSLGQ
jgi:hypothetical protein